MLMRLNIINLLFSSVISVCMAEGMFALISNRNHKIVITGKIDGVTTFIPNRSMFLLIALICLTCTAKAVENGQTNVDNLIAVVQVFRHGQRSPITHFPNDPYSNDSFWPVEPGQLTSVGKQQQYALGNFTRTRYDGFLPKKYHPNAFRAQTTDVDRTHMSCQANIAAIFPPQEDEIFVEGLNWQPIPVHPTPKNVLSVTPDCNIYVSEMAYLALKDPLYAQLNIRFASTYEHLTEYSGMTVNSVVGVATIWDDLFIESQFNYTLPNWTSDVYPQPMEVLNGYEATLYSYTKEMKRLIAGTWLNEVITYFESMWEDQTSSAKFQMYSAHDTNIASILNTLGAFDDVWPAFASSIYIELRNISNTATINVWHKNDDLFEAITVQGCSFNCTLSQFKESVEDYVLDTATWEEECAATKTSALDLLQAALSENVFSEMSRITNILNEKKS